jgi:uncharacterized protein YwgA
MGSPEDPLTTREVVLLVLDAAGGEIDGRTAAQKLCYFVAGAIDQDLGHRAHYFGPYSRQVESALSNSAFAGDIEETVRLFSSGRAYHYKLSSQGQSTVTELSDGHPLASRTIKSTIANLRRQVPTFAQHPLSLAAKVDLIVRQQGGSIATDAIPSVAERLGWDVSSADVALAVKILVGLDRVQTSS